MAQISNTFTIAPDTADTSGNEYERNRRASGLNTVSLRLTADLAANTDVSIGETITTNRVVRVEVNNTVLGNTQYTVNAGGTAIQFAAARTNGDIIVITEELIQDLSGGYFTSTTNNDNASDNFNHGINGQGTYIQPNGGAIIIGNQANVIAGTMKIGGDNTNAGGQLTIDGGTLTVNRLATAGNIGFGGTTLTYNTSSTPSTRPTLTMRNGAILNMMGSSGNPWRAFLGNHAQGRLLLSDATINFSNTNAGNFAGNGTSLGNCFLGHDSTFNDVLITGMNKVELLGAILEFNNVTIEYTTAGDLSGPSGALYLAGQANIVGTLGDHEIILPPTSVYTLYPTSGNAYFKYASLRNKATGLTINGTATITQGSSSFSVRCHDLYFEGSGNSDLTNFFIFQNTLELTAARFSSAGTSLGNGGAADTKVLMMDNRDLFQVDKTHSDFTNGALSDSTYTWYQVYKRSLTGARNDLRIPYGWPTGKAATFRNATNGAGATRVANTDAIARAANRTYQDTGQANTIEISNLSNLSGVTRLTGDMRRFYPFRVGYHQWGYIPEYINSGLGTQDFLGNSTITKGDLVSAETSPNDIRDGKMIGISTTQDDAIGSIALSAVDTTNVSIGHPNGSAGELTVTLSGGAGTQVSLNKLHHNMARYVYQNIDSDDVTQTATALDSSNNDGNDSSTVATATAANAGTANEVLFFTETNPSSTTTSAAGSAAWNTLNYVQFNSGNRLLDRASGSSDAQEDNTIDGYLYFYRSSGQWGFYSYTRGYNEGNPSVSNSTRARLTHIASEGSIGADGGSIFMQRAGLIDGTSFTQAYPRRSYLWDSQVGLKPSEYIGENVLRIRRTNLVQTANSRFVKTSTGTQDRINTIDLELSTDELQCGNNALAVDVTGAGAITGIITTSTATAPAVQAGVTVGAGVTMTFIRGSTYYIAGDISAATLAIGGTGTSNATLIQVGNGVLPSSVATGYAHQKIVTLNFTAPGNNTWTVANASVDERINIAAFAGTGVSAIDPIQPASSLTGALNQGSGSFQSTTPDTDGEWNAVPTGGGGTGTNITTLPTSWDWSDSSNTDRPNQGIRIHGFSSTELATLNTYLNDATHIHRQLLITDGGSNWAIYRITDIQAITNLGDNILVKDLDLLQSSGAPVASGLTFYFSVNSSGAHVDVSEGTNETVPIPTLSNSNRTLTYLFTIDPSHNLHYAFAARDGTAGNWYVPIAGDTSSSDTVSHTLTEYSTAVVPTTVSSGAGMSAQVTYINTVGNDVVNVLTSAASATNRLDIQINNAATAGNVTDGNYITRLIMQKDHFLQNAALGYYPVTGIDIGQTEVTYNNRFVTWHKSTADNNVVGFTTAVVDSGRASINTGSNSITTSNVQTLVSFNPAATVAFVPSADLDTINTIDRTTKATLGQVL